MVATCSASCVAPGIFSEEPEALTENGNPVINDAIELTCHPPSSADATPLWDSHGLRFPNGSSHIPWS